MPSSFTSPSRRQPEADPSIAAIEAAASAAALGSASPAQPTGRLSSTPRRAGVYSEAPCLGQPPIPPGTDPGHLHAENVERGLGNRSIHRRGEPEREHAPRVERIDDPVVPEPRGRVVRVALGLVLV